MAAVSMWGEAQWPSHRAPSVGTQLTLIGLMGDIGGRAAVSLSMVAQSQSSTPKCIPIEQHYMEMGVIGAAVSSSLVGQSPCHRAPSLATQFLGMEAVSMSIPAPSRLRLPRSLAIPLLMERALASSSILVQSQSSDPKYTTMGTSTMSTSQEEPPSAPSERSSPASLA